LTKRILLKREGTWNRSLSFTKCHGYGNDFLIIEEKSVVKLGLSLSEISQLLCRRRFGIGADGVVLWAPTSQPHSFNARIFNADGSEAESSGNGLRCLAAGLIQTGIVSETDLSLTTDGGVKTFTLLNRSGPEYLFQANLGKPSFEAEQIPFADLQATSPIVDYPITIGNRQFRATILATGNPHIIIRLPEINSNLIEEYGPLLETHPLFPARVNVEFVTVASPETLDILIWERGVGRTRSSGTGSAAAVVAAVLNGWTKNRVLTRMEGGDMWVEWSEDSDIVQEGGAIFVFHGLLHRQFLS